MPAISKANILILADNGFEQSELEEPRDQLEKAGATETVATPTGEAVKGWDGDDWGRPVSADMAMSEVDTSAYDALVLPGGQINPDLLHVNKTALRLIREMYDAGKVIATICHAPWLLVEIGALKGRRATSYHSVKTDLINAGADWVDEAAVRDAGLITSRSPEDIDAFVDAIIAEIESDTPFHRAA